MDVKWHWILWIYILKFTASQTRALAPPITVRPITATLPPIIPTAAPPPPPPGLCTLGMFLPVAGTRCMYQQCIISEEPWPGPSGLAMTQLVTRTCAPGTGTSINYFGGTDNPCTDYVAACKLVTPNPTPGPGPTPCPGPVPVPVPVPVPNPVPVPCPPPTTIPVPVPNPIPSPCPAPRPIPVPVPNPIPIPCPAPQPIPVPVPVPNPVPVPVPNPVPTPCPGPIPVPVPVPVPNPIPVPCPGPGPGPVTVPPPTGACTIQGQFLPVPNDPCAYNLCVVNPNEPWQDQFGNFQLIALPLPCAPGTGYSGGSDGPCSSNVIGCGSIGKKKEVKPNKGGSIADYINLVPAADWMYQSMNNGKK